MCGNSEWRRPKYVNIYLMNVVGSDIYKIGYTTMNPEKRKYVVKYFVGDVKVIDYVYCDFKYEAFFHEKFKSQKIDNGFREYFKLSEIDVNYVLSTFNKIKVDKPIMDDKHSDWKIFLRHIKFYTRLRSFKCNHTFFRIKDYLNKYNNIDVEKSIDFLKQRGVNCDCDILKIV